MALGSKSGPDEIGNLLSACLELIEGGEVSIDALLGRYGEFREVLRPPLEAALWLYRRSWLFDPSPAFVSACRSKIVDRVRAETGRPMSARIREHTPKDSSYGRWNSLSLWIALLSILVLVWVGANSLSFWMGNSVPGDPLHGVKLAQEQLQMVLSFSSEREIESCIHFAETRFVETERLIIAGRESHLPQAVAKLDLQVADALLSIARMGQGDPEQANLYASQLESTLLRESEKLAALREYYPPASQQAIDQVLAVSADALQQIHRRN